MLRHIYIKDFAIIEEIQLDFEHGLNIITGETGAGKSIIVDAIQLAIGGRSSSVQIRNGKSKSIIECIFSHNNQIPQELLTEYINDEISKDELIIRRELYSRGTSRAFINDIPASVTKLKELGQYLVDFHGQHEHQSLLNDDSHIDIIDLYCNNEELVAEYKFIYSELNDYIEKLKFSKKNQRELLAKQEFIKLQIQEISKVSPKLDEDQQLEKELRTAENAELLMSLSSNAANLLYNNEDSIYNNLIRAEKIISQLNKFESKFDEYKKEIDSNIISIKEIAYFTKEYANAIEFDTYKIEQMRNRMLQIKSLQKKYGSIEEILKLHDSNITEISNIENFDNQLEESEKAINQKIIELGTIANILSIRRKEFARHFELEIESKLKKLGIENAKFSVDIRNDIVQNISSLYDQPLSKVDDGLFKSNTLGIDKVKFLISANLGSEPKSLSETASGGEISRVMLAIKSILSGKDKVPTMVFDEIDTGISGRIARKVGLSMMELSKLRQIIAITHLPQIASLANLNISVKKTVDNNNTIAIARPLNSQEKINEIAMLISGEEITRASIDNAINLINSESENE